MYLAKTDTWYLERIVWVVAGTFTLAGTVLAWLVSPWWLILPALVGINLLVFAFTGFCLVANILYWLGARPCSEREKPATSSGAAAGPAHVRS